MLKYRGSYLAKLLMICWHVEISVLRCVEGGWPYDTLESRLGEIVVAEDQVCRFSSERPRYYPSRHTVLSPALRQLAL